MSMRTSDGRPKSKTITIEQVASPARRPEIQRETLIGLGLDKMGRRKTLVNSLRDEGYDQPRWVEALTSCGLSPAVRAEVLSVPQFIELSRLIRP